MRTMISPLIFAPTHASKTHTGCASRPNGRNTSLLGRLSAVASLVGFLAMASTVHAAGPITLKSLLHDMTDRQQLTRFPDPAYTTRLFSSYDRASVAPDKPGWFANGDSSQFIREEKAGDRTELVMLDAEGPGAIVRFWVTVAGSKQQGILRIYLDNSATPVIEGNVLELLSGGKLCPEPLSTSVSTSTAYLQRGHNLYLPIPYAQHCKITYEMFEKKESFYYNVEARTYGKDVAVETLTADSIRTNADSIAEANRKLSGAEAGAAHPVAGADAKGLEGTIAPGESLTKTLTTPGAIQRLVLSLGADANFNQALRSTILEMSFDGERTVWVPLGEFFATGYKLSPHKTWFASVAADGTMQSDWVMPFEKTCTITIRNLGSEPVTVAKAVLAVAPYRWGASSMHFGAGWYELRRHATGGKDLDANYVALTGQGVLVGTGVTVFNTVDSWWGEGDEKVYVDGEAFPSFFGTGSEDYYGYAWCVGNRFDHPFLAQPDGSGDLTQGFTVNVRYRALDTIPFTKGLRFDMEIYHHSSSAKINYAPASFWYMKPGGTATLGKSKLPLGDEKIQAMAKEKIVTKRNDLVQPEPFVRGRLEGEFMDGSATNGRIVYTKGWGQRWSGGEVIAWLDGKPNDTAQFTFVMKDATPAEIIFGFVFDANGGKVQVSVNDKVIVKEMETYSERNMRIQMDGAAELKEGENIIKVQLLGKNDKARSSNFLLDYVEIWPKQK